jgi:hypothetical protein
MMTKTGRSHFTTTTRSWRVVGFASMGGFVPPRP